MFTKKLLLYAVLIVFISNAVLPATCLAYKQNNYPALDSALQALTKDQNCGVPGLAVAAVKNGRLVYEKTLGLRYTDNQGITLPYTPDTKVRIASLSKTFTAAAYMQLVEQGKIDLDADVSRYLGFTLRNPHYPHTAITSRMLLSHTSSLRDGSVYNSSPEYGLREFFVPQGIFYGQGEHYAPLGEAPGEYFFYANINYGILGTIIEKVTGTRFDIYMRDGILRQMQMDASFNLNDFTEDSRRNFACVYQKKTDGVWNKYGGWEAQVNDCVGYDRYAQFPISYQPGTNAMFWGPHGGLRISLRDLEKWLLMFMQDGVYQGRRILTKESVDLMFAPYWNFNFTQPNGDTYGGLMNSFGLGMQIMSGRGGDKFTSDRKIVMTGHFGEAYGLLAGMFMDRTKQNGFIYVMNGMSAPEEENKGVYSGMYRWEERFCTAVLDNVFPEL